MRFAHQNDWIKRGAGAGLLLLAGPVAAMAQMQVPTHTETVFRWLNFVFVFGVGGWWLWGKLKVGFRRKADSIAAAIADREHRADFLDFDGLLVIFDLLAQDLGNFVSFESRHISFPVP